MVYLKQKKALNSIVITLVCFDSVLAIYIVATRYKLLKGP